MNRNLGISICFILATAVGPAQSEGLTSSPYSLFGLGVLNQTTIGKSNSLGYTGIGLKSQSTINNLNPANFSLIPKNSFLYDIGITSEYNSYDNQRDSEDKTNVNFSNLAFAFRITEGLGMGVSLVPYSDVGYSLIGIQNTVEGSDEIFESNIGGLGGLNDLRLNLGYRIVPNLRIGMSGSFLFGNIEKNEALQVGTSAFQATENTNYSGFRLGFGLQYDILKNITLGSTVQVPVHLIGTMDRFVLKSVEGTDAIVEDTTIDNVSGFKIPMELGFGMSAKLYQPLTLSVDYKKNFWGATGQTENIGSYLDQDIYAVGLEYQKNPASYKYGDRIGYRAGFNYDSGYLAINNIKISGFNLTAGIGLPIGRTSNSMLNLSYSYGSKGEIQNILIKEDYHLITLNLSLEDLWFRKRRIN